ncbi:MAG: hypothetical protein AAFQ83_10730 [Bacteroidota bacterium]
MDPWIIGDGLETTPWRYWGDHVVALLGRPRRGIIGETTPWRWSYG